MIMFAVGIVLLFIFILILVFMAVAVDYGFYKFWAPKYKAVERQVFEETQSYVHGANQELAKLYLEWKQASTETEKKAIEEVVRMRFAQFPADKVANDEIREWFEDIMAGR